MIRYLPAVGIALCLLVVVEIWLPTENQVFSVAGKEEKQLTSVRGVKKFFKLKLAGGGWADYYVNEDAYNIVHTGDLITVDMSWFTREWRSLVVVGTGESADLGRAIEPFRLAYAFLGIAFGMALFVVRGTELLRWISFLWPLPLFWEFLTSTLYW